MPRTTRPLAFALPNQARGFELTRPAIIRVTKGGTRGAGVTSPPGLPVQRPPVRREIQKPADSPVARGRARLAGAAAPRFAQSGYRPGMAGRKGHTPNKHF